MTEDTITTPELIAEALRIFPARIIIGEVRGAEWVRFIEEMEGRSSDD